MGVPRYIALTAPPLCCRDTGNPLLAFVRRQNLCSDQRHGGSRLGSHRVERPREASLPAALSLRKNAASRALEVAAGKVKTGEHEKMSQISRVSQAFEGGTGANGGKRTKNRQSLPYALSKIETSLGR
ncbi:hypothetical protein Esti_004749 [Eimeria stiedai]